MTIIKEATKEKMNNKKNEIKSKVEEKKIQIKDAAEKNNVFKKENRVRIKENAAHDMAVNKLALAYSHNNTKYIDKFIKETDKSKVEELWREAIYDHGGKLAADMLYSEIVEGADYINNPNKYQSMISKYDHYNLALLIEDGKDIDPDFIIDSLADGINVAADNLGYEEIYHFEKKDENDIPIVEFDNNNMPIPTIERDENKILVNTKRVVKEKPITEVINEMELDPAQKEKLLRTEAKKQQKAVELHKDDFVVDYTFPTEEELEKAKEDYKKNYLKEARTYKKKEDSAEKESSSKTTDTTATNEKPVKNHTAAEKIIEKIEDELKPAPATKKTTKKTNLKEVVDPFEEILGQPAPTGEEKAPEKESVSSTTKSRKTGGKATAKKSV